CKQSELDMAVQKAAAKAEREGKAINDDERRKLVSTEQSLGMPAEPKMPSAIAGLETFSLGDDEGGEAVETPEAPELDVADADSFFNLPDSGDAEKEED
ncbi:MAG: DUF1013 domain-containing protein, partial [Pseudomonadota bacterium]